MKRRLGDPSFDVLIFCDGSCIGNPGPGGYGVVIQTQEETRELGGYYAHTTNNRMEIESALHALEFCATRSWLQNSIKICSDSSYFIKGATQWVAGWKQNNWMSSQKTEILNQDLWKRWTILSDQFEHLQLHKVLAHAGIPGNERCDEIGKSFANQNPTRLYNGKTSTYPLGFLTHHSQNQTPLSATSNHQKIKPYYLSYLNGALTKHDHWEDCSKLVKGVSGAKYKKISSVEEEQEIKRKWGIDPTESKNERD
jgi:ribonuclease HI